MRKTNKNQGLSINTWVTILIVAMAMINLAYSQQQDTSYTYDDYSRQFNRSYEGQEYQLRKQIFVEEYRRIQQLQSQANGNCHYEVNNYTDWTEEQKKALRGYTQQTGRRLSTLPLKYTSNPNTLGFPSSFDYRQLDVVTPVRNQGNCGSCWAFSALAVYQSLLAMETGIQYDLSEQFVLDCTWSGSCDGGYPIDALQVLAQLGAPLEETFPYQQQDLYYQNICQHDQNVLLSNYITNTFHYYSLSDPQLKQILYDYGPVSVGVYANTAFDYYSSGVFDGCPSYSSSYINHAVLLIGYTSEGNWIIKNSWGTNWGDSGYMIISKDYDCGLKSYVDVIEADWSGFHTNDNDTNSTDGNNEQQSQYTNFTTVNYRVQMTDSYGDGWDGFVFGVWQDDQWTSTFGADFLDGHSYGPVNITVKQGIPAKLLVVSYSSYAYQVGFTINDQKGNLIFVRCADNYFVSSTVFHSWCPNCQENQQQQEPMFQLRVTMSDSWGDGWNGNSIALKQDNQIVATFGQNFISGHLMGPISVLVPIGKLTNIVVYTVGSWRSEVGFTIKDTNGNQLFRRISGYTFSATILFGSICPGCVSSFKARIVPVDPQVLIQKPITNPLDVHYVPPTQASQIPQSKQNAQQTKDKQSSDDTQQNIKDSQTEQKSGYSTALLASTIIMSVFTIFFMMTTVCLFCLWKNERNLLFPNPKIQNDYYEKSLLKDQKLSKQFEEIETVTPKKRKTRKMNRDIQASQQQIIGASSHQQISPYE